MLTIKHWQVLLLLLVYLGLLVTILNGFNIQTTSIVDGVLFNMIPSTIYPLLLGNSLRRLNANDPQRGPVEGKRSFNIYGFVWVTTFLVYLVIVHNSETIWRVIPGIFMLYAFYRFAKYPSQIINYYERRPDPGFWVYISDVFQIACWPICIWWIQPRVNAIFEKQLRRRNDRVMPAERSI
jgi:hypothetical protein